MNNPSNPLQAQYTLAKQKIDSAQDILILLPQQNSPDTVAAGLALYSSIKQKYNSNGNTTKRVTIASPTPLPDHLKPLPNAKQIQQSVGTKNMVITINTAMDNIEKVATDDDQGKFNIIIETKPDLDKLTQEDISVSYRGVSSDLIITISVSNSQQLGSLLSQEPKLLEGRDIITLTHQFQPADFGSININDPQISGASEMISSFLKAIKPKPSQEITTNILAGIESATNNFTNKSSAETFSTVAWCIRNHAQRNILSGETPISSPQMPRPIIPNPMTPQTPPFPNNPFGNFPRPPIPNFPQPMPPASGQFPPDRPPTTPPQPFQSPPTINPPFSPSPPTRPNPPVIEGTQDNQPQPKKDWYQPKIFKGGHNV